jgi:hypothetical protein
MLHLNAAGDWAGTMGATFDEGETEILTMKVCASQQIAITPAYGGQRGRTAQLAEVVGAGLLEHAYFGGAAAVVTAFDTVRGEGKWAEVKKAIGDGDADKFDKLLKAPHASSSAKEKIQLINGIIHSFWVTDADVASIQVICSTASPEDLKAIAAAVGPEVSSLTNEGQRARVRIALGM